MTQNEIIDELRDVIAGNQEFTTWTVSTPHLVLLIQRAVLREREACANECDNIVAKWRLAGFRGEMNAYAECAAAIRARGDK